MLKQVFLARFEPVLTEFSPFHHMYAPLCALRTYLRAVWWSHLELGEGCRLEDIYIYIYIYIYTYIYIHICVVRHCTTLYDASYSVVQCRTVSYMSYKRRTTLYDASYSVVQGVGARRVGDVRRVVQCCTRCRGPTRRGCTTRREVSGPDAS